MREMERLTSVNELTSARDVCDQLCSLYDALQARQCRRSGARRRGESPNSTSHLHRSTDFAPLAGRQRDLGGRLQTDTGYLVEKGANPSVYRFSPLLDIALLNSRCGVYVAEQGLARRDPLALLSESATRCASRPRRGCLARREVGAAVGGLARGRRTSA